MTRTLLVTNDFPPTIGGIQSYLRDFVNTLDPRSIGVFASTQDEQAAAAFDAQQTYRVHRWPGSILLPTPSVSRRMQELIRAEDIDTVWFGAAAPLALLGPAAKRAGAWKVIATTHGHEVGWSMLPGARQALRRIGTHADVVTYISRYTRRRLERAFGPHPEWVHLPSGVSTDVFQPATKEDKARAREELELDDDAEVIVCISRLVARKGQDQLLRAMPRIREQRPNAQLVIVGSGGYRATLERLRDMYDPTARFVSARGTEELVRALHAADIFAMPARTRGGGLDVEGLGIVYLEAQAAGLPVVAGDSGGAPETVTPRTGIVVRGRDVGEIAAGIVTLLSQPALRAQMGQEARSYVEREWTWDVMGNRLAKLLM